MSATDFVVVPIPTKVAALVRETNRAPGYALEMKVRGCCGGKAIANMTLPTSASSLPLGRAATSLVVSHDNRIATQPKLA